MSVGPLGVVGGLAGSPVSQTSGAAVERARQDATAQRRQVESTQQAADAAGIGHTSEERETSERDADGRLPWEIPGGEKKADAAGDEPVESPRQSRDPTGEAGGELDLTG